MSTTENYLKKYFQEKVIPEQVWELEDNVGVIHYITSEVVIEFILSVESAIQQRIATTLRTLDFHNQPILPFLEHLARGMIALPT
jgi:hypothetical protein